MPQYDGTVEEFEDAAGGMSKDELTAFKRDDRVGIKDAASRELERRKEAKAGAATAVSFEAHMAQDGMVVVDNLNYDDPDFLDAAAEALTSAAALARTRHASAIALEATAAE